MKRTLRWMLVILVLTGIVFSIGLAGAEQGKTLEVRFTIPTDVPRLRSGVWSISGDEQSECTFTRNPGGSTCVPYTFTVSDGTENEQMSTYRYLIGCLDDFRPGNNTADTLYKSNLTDNRQLTYTFYQPGNYVLFIKLPNESVATYRRIYITQDQADNPLTAAVNAAAARCNTGDEFDTAVAINDYLAEINTYDDSFTYYSPEAALLGSDYSFGHTSVCNGYSRAYQLIAEACGLECRRVTGIANGGGHAWNAVKVNGNWYQVDPTWNDAKLTSNGQVVDNRPLWHAYMLLNDGSMLADHSSFDYPEGRVSCHTLEDNYFIHENKWRVLIPDESSMADLQAALDAMTGAGGTITADYGTTVWREDGKPRSFSKGRLTINGNIVAYALSRTDLYRTDDATTPIRGSFSYTYNEADTPASKLTGEITAGTTDPTRVQLTVPAGNSGQLPVHTNQSVTITMASGATQAGFYDGEFWTSLETNQKSVTMDVPFNVAGEKTMMARAYYEDADGTGEWVYSNVETRTFVPGEPLARAEFSIDYYSVEQGKTLPVTFYEVEDAEMYLFQVANNQQEQIYQNLMLNAEDLDLMPGGWSQKTINVPTDGMPKGKYSIRVYASAYGREDSCSEALISVSERTTADEPYLSVDKTQALIGQKVIITAHVPGAASVGLKCEEGESTDDLFCSPLAGDTGMWACDFDRAGVYTLNLTGWSGAVWDEQDSLTEPDLPESAVSITVTVTALPEEEEPEAHITIPNPLTENSTITVSFDEFPGATAYSVKCAQEIGSDPVYYRSGRTPFTAEISAACLKADEAYYLEAEVNRTGYTRYYVRYQVSRKSFDDDSLIALAYYREEGKDAPTWHLRENMDASGDNDIEIDRATAMEYSQEQIRVILDEIPTEASGDRAVIENRDIAMSAVFNPGCSGSYTMDFSAFPDIDVQLTIDAPELMLTIIGPTGETDPLISMDVRNAGSISCTWTVADLRLRGSRADGLPMDVYVEGDVGNLSYYDATSDMPFIGTLTVTGRINQGTVYGQMELTVPGIKMNNEPVRFGSIDRATFTYENTAVIPALEQVIEYVPTERKSRLNPDVDRQGIGDLTLDMFKLTYQYRGAGRVSFDVSPKEGTGLGGLGGSIENILDAEYNPTFTTDNIIWGDDTTVYFIDTGETPYTLNGGTDDNGNKTGIGALYLQNCNVTVNCPVGFLKTRQYRNDPGPVNLTINETADRAEVLFFRDGGGIHLGPNGVILEGVWDRGIRGYREIGTMRGECDYAVDGALRVLSAKDGQRTKAIPASDKAVTTAAGLSGQRTAVMDVNDATVAPEETGVLNEYLAAHNLTSQNVVNVFDVSVTAYTVDEQGNAMGKIGDISQLNKGVLVAVGNDSGEAVSVVRLHEDEDGVLIAERLTGNVSGTKVQFTSDLFSTYVLVKGEAELDPANLTKLTLPAGLKRIEESAFEGISAQAIFIPAGCEFIGSKAFRNCPNLMYVQYYEGTEVAPDAFEECNSLEIKVIPRAE